MNNLMDLLKKTLFVALVILVYFFLLGTSFDLLTKPNTISNFLGFIGFTFLFAIGIVFIYNAVKLWVGKSEYETIKDKEWKEHIMKQMEAMHKQNEESKKKSNPKQFDGVESDKFFVKTRKKTIKTK